MISINMEAGKWYTYLPANTQKRSAPWYCVGKRLDGGYLMEADKNGGLLHSANVSGWQEYKEPVVHKADVIWVRRYRDGGIVPFTETCKHNYVVGSPYTTGWVVAVKPISYTEET